MSRHPSSFLPTTEDFWEEIRRRCDEAEAHPERLLSPEEFFRDLREMIEQEKAKRRAEKNQEVTKPHE